MRVLTKRETASFLSAWRCIERLALIPANHDINDYCLEIKAGKSVGYEEIPERLKTIFNKFRAKGKNVNSFYSDFYRVNGNFDIFVKECFRNKVQPKEFWFDGIIIHKKSKMEEGYEFDRTVKVVTYEETEYETPDFEQAA